MILLDVWKLPEHPSKFSLFQNMALATLQAGTNKFH